MLHTSRHDKELALLDPFVPVAKLHAEAALDHQEHFIFIRMMMKHELPEDFVQLDMLPVQFSYDIRLPVFRNLPKLLGDVDLVHVALPAFVCSHVQIRRPQIGRKDFSASSAPRDVTKRKPPACADG